MYTPASMTPDWQLNIDRDSEIRCQTYKQELAMALFQVIKVNKQW